MIIFWACRWPVLWREILNSDAADLWRVEYGQCGRGSCGRQTPRMAWRRVARLTLPPLATLFSAMGG
jgi:hypothetical protein